MAGAELKAWLEAEREDGVLPAYQALVREDGRTLFEAAGGVVGLGPRTMATDQATLFDVASLTKPLVSARVVLHLAEEGLLPLDLPVGRVLEAAAAGDLARITVLDLLTHRSGLLAWAPLYLEKGRLSLERFADLALARGLRSAPGAEVVYSDLGYLVLGALIEAVTGRPFLAVARALVLTPERADAVMPCPKDRLPNVAATERGNRYEAKLAGIEAEDPRLRQDLIWGEVHDGNAFALGGAAPHAGLFATAAAVADLASVYLGGDRLLPASRALALADLTAGLAAHRSAAFERGASPGSAGHGVLAEDAVGHTGFTGTSVFLEPGRRRVYVLLTNRVHPEVKDLSMNEVRRRFHRLASAL